MRDYYFCEIASLPDGVNSGYRIWRDASGQYNPEVYTTFEKAKSALDAIPPMPFHRRRIMLITRTPGGYDEKTVYIQEPIHK